MKGTSYADEQAMIRNRLERVRAEMGRLEIAFLTHGMMMQASQQWAKENNVPYVDGIAALDQDRDVLLSWVHLSPRGNRLLANAIAPTILKQTCKGGDVGGTLK